ncbi:Uncharacterised protein [Mycobacterium tuberculosis]|nr:Uncharacterised protein [Mycobacterium tuberculosis]
MLFDVAVDDGAQLEIGRVKGSEVGDDPRPDRAEGVVPLGSRPLTVGLLLIAGRHVIADGVAEDIVDGLGGRDILARPADHDRQLTLEVHR